MISLGPIQVNAFAVVVLTAVVGINEMWFGRMCCRVGSGRYTLRRIVGATSQKRKDLLMTSLLFTGG